MKESIGLIITGIILSILAWAFWHYSGAYGVDVLSTIFLLALGADNIRLRRQIRHYRRL